MRRGLTSLSGRLVRQGDPEYAAFTAVEECTSEVMPSGTFHLAMASRSMSAAYTLLRGAFTCRLTRVDLTAATSCGSPLAIAGSLGPDPGDAHQARCHEGSHGPNVTLPSRATGPRPGLQDTVSGGYGRRVVARVLNGLFPAGLTERATYMYRTPRLALRSSKRDIGVVPIRRRTTPGEDRQTS